MKYFKYIISVLIVGLIGCGLMWFYSSKTHFNLNQAAVVKQIQNLSRLETAQFTIEKIIDTKTPSENVFQQFLFGDQILLVAHGDVIAGYDLADLHENDVVIKGDSLTIHLPPAKILVTRLDNSQTQVYDRKKGLLTPENSNLETQARQEAESEITKAACTENILSVARTNAQKQLSTFFTSFGFKQVTIDSDLGSCP